MNAQYTNQASPYFTCIRIGYIKKKEERLYVPCIRIGYIKEGEERFCGQLKECE
jgi:hypothetical protein